MKKWGTISLLAAAFLLITESVTASTAGAPVTSQGIANARTVQVPVQTKASGVSSSTVQKEKRTVLSTKTSMLNVSMPSKTASPSNPTINLANVKDRQIIVNLKKGILAPIQPKGTKLVLQNGHSVVKGFEILQVNEDQRYETILQDVKQNSNVASASPNYMEHVSYTPQSALLKQQWYLKNINMFNAWDLTKGDQNQVTVAVLDTGVNANHPALTGQVLSGYNFVDNNTDTSDDNGHGTAVAGIIASSLQSGSIVGIDFNAKILPIKVADSNGDLQDSLIIKGILYAIDHGVKVINMSFGGTDFDQAMNDALQKAHDAGIVLVAASGNDGSSTWEFPASDENVISVAATDETSFPAIFSNFGDWVDLGAPGVNMMVPANPTGYSHESGTSFASPIVSGAAALLLSMHPTWTPDLIEWVLEQSASGGTDHSWDPSWGYGRINVLNALKTNPPTGWQSLPTTTDKAVPLNNGVAINRSFMLPNEKDWYSFNVEGQAKVTLSFSGGLDSYDLSGDLYTNKNGKLAKLVNIDNEPSGVGESYSFTAQPGTYDFSVYDYYGHWSSTPYTVTVAIQEATPPTASFASGTYDHTLSVALTGPPGYGIKYTLDGTMPSATNGLSYTKPIPVKKTTTIKAISLSPNGSSYSKVASYTYTIQLPPFPDIAGSFAEKEISYLATNGWIKGHTDGNFGPNEKITRAQAAVIIASQLNLPPATPTFSDVSTPQYAYAVNAIGAMEQSGIIKGHDDGTYDPAGYVTRGQVAAILVNAYNLQSTGGTLAFTDVQPDDWDGAFVQALVDNQIAKGYQDSTFKPNQPISRAEFSVMLAKVINPSFR